MARRNIALARAIHPCPNFFYLLCPNSSCILWRICVYIYTHTHIYYVETVYELPLLPNNSASETFLHKSGEVRSFDWIFIIEAPTKRWLGEYVISEKTIYSLLFKQEAVEATITSTISTTSRSSRRPLLQNIIIILRIIIKLLYALIIIIIIIIIIMW